MTWTLNANGKKEEALSKIVEQGQQMGTLPSHEAEVLDGVIEMVIDTINKASDGASVSLNASGSGSTGVNGPSSYLSISLSVAAPPG